MASPWRLRLALVVGLVSLALIDAAAADAGTVTFAWDGSTWNVTFTASPGEVNSTVVTPIPNAANPGMACTAFSPCVRISDTNAMSESSASCVSASATAVDCARTGPTRATVLLGDNGDSVTTSGPLDFPLSADGGLGDDTITGGDAGDDLAGGGGVDSLTGGIGADRLEGGGGPDSYAGGPDDDTLVTSYDNDDFHGGGGFDTVDYTGWQSFDSGCFPDPCPIGVTVTVDDVADDGSYDLDTDGTTQTAADNVRTDVEAVIGTAHADTLDGGPLNAPQELTGAGGDDVIIGGPGSDRVVGAGDANWTLTDASLNGAGTDSLSSIELGRLVGGPGPNVLDASGFSGAVDLQGADEDDTLTGGLAADSIDGGQGTDTVLATADPLHPSLTLAGSTLTGLGTDSLTSIDRATLRGDSANNTLDASGASIPVALEGGPGIDTLQGGTNADTLTGGPGNDTLDGAGGGADRLVEAADADFTLTDGALASPGYGNDTLLGVELATLGGGAGANAIDASAFSGAVALAGGSGPDSLTGGAAGDTVDGEAGSDVLRGGPGADALNGGDANDTLDGGAGADALNGGDADDTLDGGADLLNDTLHGDAGVNRVVGSADTNFTLTNTSLIGQGNDALFEIQRATLTGGPGGNALNAGAFTLGPVILDGAGGADSLLGGSQGDTLIGGPAADSFDAGAGDDDLRARDGAVDASLVCGPGAADVANVDLGETADVSCESVLGPPQATILGGPSGVVSSSEATFTFGGSANTAGFRCSLDGGVALPCASPQTYAGLADGSHTFNLSAQDSGGDVGPTVSRTWTVQATAPPMPDTTPPQTTITKGPAKRTKKRSAKFEFASDEAGSRFECSLDSAKLRPCTSPRAAKVKPGRHTFKVRAIDAAGNADPTPATKSWRVKKQSRRGGAG